MAASATISAPPPPASRATRRSSALRSGTTRDAIQYSAAVSTLARSSQAIAAPVTPKYETSTHSAIAYRGSCARWSCPGTSGRPRPNRSDAGTRARPFTSRPSASHRSTAAPSAAYPAPIQAVRISLANTCITSASGKTPRYTDATPRCMSLALRAGPGPAENAGKSTPATAPATPPRRSIASWGVA